MSTTCSAPAQAQGLVTQSRHKGPVAVLRCWWVDYMTWRMEQAAIARLSSMSDRELKDIGLIRSNIVGAVSGDAADWPFRRY